MFDSELVRFECQSKVLVLLHNSETEHLIYFNLVYTLKL